MTKALAEEESLMEALAEQEDRWAWAWEQPRPQWKPSRPPHWELLEPRWQQPRLLARPLEQARKLAWA